MLSGVLYGLGACVLWGFVYLVPLVLPDYDPVIIATARYISFGLVAVPLMWMQRHEFAHYTLKDWGTACALGVLGNCVYYWLLLNCINMAGAPFAGMCMALIPVLVAVIANLRDKKRGRFVRWRSLIPALVLIFAGLVLANISEFKAVVAASQGNPERFWYGVLFGIAALAVWTWYPICNADWLIDHPKRTPRAWTTAQGLATLPVACAGFALVQTTVNAGGPLLGPQPVWFVFVMIASGLLCSWVGTVFWSEMSQRLPTALAGQMIVFETLFAVVYAHTLRLEWPVWSMTAGMVLLVLGVLLSLRVFYR